MAQSYPKQFGEYRLLRKIAQGGMAELFLAEKDGQVCALKRILPHLAHEEGFIRMFIDEARIVKHLEHPNVAGVYDQGKVEGYYFIAMEYVEGHSLLALHERARSLKIPLPFGLLAYVIADLLAGLASAHNARDKKGRHLGVVHRDVTPQNVMISYDGDVKLIDFGVAKARARLTKTEAGFTKGKLAYMSPEQARGEELDGRSDLFAVGIVLWEITTGHRLFNKEGPGGILGAIVNDPIPLPSTKKRKYPGPLEDIVMRALDKEVDTRWQSAEEMRAALLRFSGRERPKPGRSRLAALVQDLFGDPEHRHLIQEAKAMAEPTPPEAVEAQVVRGASIGMGDTKVPDLSAELEAMERKADETRMMDLAASAEVSSFARPEATDEGVPVVEAPLAAVEHEEDLHDDLPVPEPTVPFRVRLGRALADFGDDLALSWRVHRRRYLLVMTMVLMGGFGVVAYATGLTNTFASWAESTRDKARELKKTAGLVNDPNRDAGVRKPVLRIGSEPPGALVEIDGIGSGCVTPCVLDEPPVGRRFELGLRLAGFRLHTEKLIVRPGAGEKALSIRLEREKGQLVVTSAPPGARVRVAGKSLPGRTPVTVDGLRAGKPVKIRVSKSGHIPRSKVVVLQDGRSLTEHFVLEIDKASIPPGRVKVISSPSGCPVEIDGQPAGLTPVVDYALKPGTYTVIVRCDYHREETRALIVDAGRSASVSITAEPNVFGYLTLRIQPRKGTKVRVNGRKVKVPVEFLKVVPGRHVVEVENEPLDKRKQFTIAVGPEKRVTRTLNLLR